MATTSIEWTRSDDGTAGVVWNPTTGCDRTSPGCDNCYALTMAARLKAMGQAKYQTDGDPRTSGPGFGLAVHREALEIPLQWRKPRRVFVNSMSDLFHDDVPRDFIADVFRVMAATPRHTYQVLTKRHGRVRALLNDPLFAESVQKRVVRVDRGSDGPLFGPFEQWPLPNVWLGVSVEDQKWADIRIPALLDTPAVVRWISAEPLLGPVNLAPDDHAGHERDWQGHDYECLECSTEDEFVAWRNQDMPPLDWAVIGGESGPGARPMELDWARTLVRQFQAAGTPVFVKQLGSRWGRHHHDISQFPPDLQVREYPTTGEVQR